VALVEMERFLCDRRRVGYVELVETEVFGFEGLLRFCRFGADDEGLKVLVPSTFVGLCLLRELILKNVKASSGAKR
jgi:hypothetical protein